MCRSMSKTLDTFYLPFYDMLLETVEQTIESRLGCVRDEREDRVAGVTAYRLKNCGNKLLAEFLALTIDVLIRAAREIDALKGASRVALRLKDLLDHRLTITAHDECRSRLKFLNIVILDIERCL